jgi:hypothetical protein
MQTVCMFLFCDVLYYVRTPHHTCLPHSVGLPDSARDRVVCGFASGFVVVVRVNGFGSIY